MTPSRAQEKPTSPPDAMPIHDGGCRCWPHVSQQDAVRAIEAVALAEYRDGVRGRREAAAATPSLNVERLAEAMAVNGISDGDGLPLFDIAEKIAAEYASTAEFGRLDEGSATPDQPGDTRA